MNAKTNNTPFLNAVTLLLFQNDTGLIGYRSVIYSLKNISTHHIFHKSPQNFTIKNPIFEKMHPTGTAKAYCSGILIDAGDNGIDHMDSRPLVQVA